MIIAPKEIEFLGMHLRDGTYYLGLHIAEELQKFPIENLSHRHV